MSQHTPGPWKVEERVEAGGIVHLAITARHAGKGWMPCRGTPPYKGKGTGLCKARVFPAPPEMLKALEALKALSEDSAGSTYTLREVFGTFGKGPAQIEGALALDAIAKVQ